MAIESSYLMVLKHVIEELQSTKKSPMTALLLAYPDLLVSRELLVRLFGLPLVEQLPARSDFENIWTWHGLPGHKQPIFDTIALFNHLGFEVEVIDIAAARGNERIVDLNEPLPSDLVARFDLVVDTGTCEHCFNVGQAFRNACEAVAENGYLVHAAPMTKSNHGFWNFCPTIYPDFFGDNGFELVALMGVTGDLKNGYSTFEIQHYARKVISHEAAVYAIAKRITRQELIWPIQRKYRKN